MFNHPRASAVPSGVLSCVETGRQHILCIHDDAMCTCRKVALGRSSDRVFSCLMRLLWPRGLAVVQLSQK